MIVDSSVLVAIVLGEPDAPKYAAALVGSPSSSMSAANWLEAAMVVDRKGDATAVALFESVRIEVPIAIASFSLTQAEFARQAWRRFGKGSGHRAQLNFGDCMAYALARERDEPLLFKGNDFAHTDITTALPA